MSNPTPTEPIKLYSRSHAVADWTCPRRRYLNYELGGTGIVSKELSLELFLGTVLHDGLAAIATQFKEKGKVDIDEIASQSAMDVRAVLGEVANPEWAKEQAALVEGLLRGFNRHTFPILMQLYPTIIAIEQEVSYEHDGLVFMAKPDLVVANHQDEVTYLEYKSTSSKKDQWIQSWNTAVQLHSTSKAIESTLGVEVSNVQVVGLYKGYIDRYGKQYTPICYGYKRNGVPPFNKDEIAYDYKPGFKRTPTWELEGGVKKWIEGMPSEVLSDQFPFTPPIPINEDLVQTFFRQRGIREFEIYEALKVTEDEELPESMRAQFMDAFFPQRWDQCSPAWGHACPYKKICHGRIENPLEAGFQIRESHHEAEREFHKQKELKSENSNP